MNIQTHKTHDNPPFLILGIVLTAIILSGIAGVLLWKSGDELPVAALKQTAEAPADQKASAKKEKQSEPVKSILRSELAGTWYPADAAKLEGQIDAYFQKAAAAPDAQTLDNVIALILPHAGYQYSGQTAAYALNTVGRKYRRIVVIGPSHRVPMEEELSVPRVTHYETPLGEIQLDVKFIDKLLQYSMFQNVPLAHKHEHSVQIEAPLLQHLQKDFLFVPIVAGQCSPETIDKAGAVLRSLVDDETLVIASSDFTHYGRNYDYVPFTENAPEQIKQLDMGAYEYITKLDGKGFLDYQQKTGATICGRIPIAILLSMLGDDVQARLANYTTSGELTHDYSNSVSYLSVVFTGKWKDKSQVKPTADKSSLTAEEKEQLLALARNAIQYYLEKRQIPEATDLHFTITEKLKAPRAAFVTLTKHGQLRGCIGDIFPRQPLYKSIINNALNACARDPRFLPVTRDEFDDLSIEISALTHPSPIASPDEIRIGIDGVVLKKDGHSAVFLPQVAPEQGWDVSQTLTRLSIKAGLPEDAWKEGASFLVFQADVFHESEE